MASTRIDRRTWFRGLFGGTAALGLHASWNAQRTDAAQIGPKDNIKVTKIETFVLKNSWVFVKVSTDAGITGWGEAFGHNIIPATKAALESYVAPWFIGKDPTQINALHRDAAQAFHIFGRNGPVVYAHSGIDIALWDIAGKRDAAR